MKFSIVIEWENAVLSELGRARTMLQRLQSQILNRPSEEFEILVMYNPEQVDINLIETILATDFSEEVRSCCRVLIATGLHYFELKNYGAKKATGDVVIFIDSDVIPEDKWLDYLIEVFYKIENANIVHGAYYIDPVSFVDKAFAINWFFPLRSDSTSVHESDRFFANNVAFKRQFFLEHPFPSLTEGRTRGACGMLAKQIRAEGFVIYKADAARVSHPGPNGIKHIFLRALAQGRDSALKRKSEYNFLTNSLRIWIRTLKKVMIRVPFETIRDFSKVDLQLWQVPGAIVLMMAYYLLMGVGGQIALIFPKWMARHIRV